MSAVKSALAIGGVVAVALGIAMGTGVISFRRGDAAGQAGSDDEAEADRLDDLESLGYVGAVEIRPKHLNKIGVTRHEPSEVHAGYNLYVPNGWGPEFERAGGGDPLKVARLIDMNGKLVKTWTSTFLDDESFRGWENAKLSPQGHLYAIVARSGIAKLDWDGRLLWALRGHYHHDLDFAVDESNDVYVLMEDVRVVERDGRQARILDNGFTVLSPDGNVRRQIWFYDQIAHLPRVQRFTEIVLKRAESNPKRVTDLLHANTVDVLDADLEGKWKRGDILTALRNLDLIAVFDKDTGELKWHWGPGQLEHPHDPELLPSGNIIIFDNGVRRKASRVVEMNPTSGEIVWTYAGDRDDPLFSEIRGLVQRLPNGNTLVIESETGRALEVTPDHEVVWEFFSPDTLKRAFRVPLRMQRLEGTAQAFAEARLAQPAAAGP